MFNCVTSFITHHFCKIIFIKKSLNAKVNLRWDRQMDEQTNKGTNRMKRCMSPNFVGRTKKMTDLEQHNNYQLFVFIVQSVTYFSNLNKY